MMNTNEGVVNSVDAGDQDRRRKQAYKFAKSKGYNKRPTTLIKALLLNGLRGGGDSDSSTSCSSDTSSSSCDQDDQDHTHIFRVSAKQLRTMVDEEHKSKREERRRKREEAEKKSMPEVDVQDKSTVEDTRSNIHDDRFERVFLLYTRMHTPTRTEFKWQIATQSIDITPEDADLLAWNETGTRVTNIATTNAMIKARRLKHSGMTLAW
jgi:hypothetical protein